MASFRIVFFSLLVSTSAAAQGLTVVPVPQVPLDLTVPHFAYNGHATTFKAIARGGNGTYLVEWDFEGDGEYETSRVTTLRFELDESFTFPNQSADKTFVANVRVTSNGETVGGEYPVRVFADVPADPAAATERQLQIMRSVAIDDGLWYLHTQLVRAGTETNSISGAQITANFAEATSANNIAEGTYLEALGRNGRYPAFPPMYLGTMPDPAANAQRWAQDPYAEDAARIVNYLLTQITILVVAAQDEVNTVGFYPELHASPIPGTDDGFGLVVGSAPGNTYVGYSANVLRGLATANLAGFVAQVGDPTYVLGRRFEHIVQQFVDALVLAQNEAGVANSWGYTPNDAVEILGEWTGGAVDVAESLWVAERWMGPHGVIVPNRVKARLLQYIVTNSNDCPDVPGGKGGSFTTSFSNVCDLANTAVYVLALGWVDANLSAATDTRFAFPSYNAITRGQLRALYDSTLAFIGARFIEPVTASAIGWDTGIIEGGDFGRTDGRADFWAMLHWSRAARAVEPEISLFGTHDYARLFSTFFIKNQTVDGGWTWALALNAFNDSGVGPKTRAGWAVLTMSPDDVVPVIVASAPATASEGSVIGFTASGGVPGALVYDWDFDNGEGANGANVAYAYPDDGTFEVAVHVTTERGTTRTWNQFVVVSNVAPTITSTAPTSVIAGMPYAYTPSFTDPGASDTHMCSAPTLPTGATLTGCTLSWLPAAGQGGASHDVQVCVTDNDGDSACQSYQVTVIAIVTSLLAMTPEASTSCPNGRRVTSGLDDGLPAGVAGNGVLEAQEVEGSTLICNGVSATAVDAGTQCPGGGIGVSVGDGAVTYICNGIDGAASANGTDGVDGQSVTVTDAGANCPNGGIGLSVGAGAVTYVCNGGLGATGVAGTPGVSGAQGPKGAAGSGCTATGARGGELAVLAAFLLLRRRRTSRLTT